MIRPITCHSFVMVRRAKDVRRRGFTRVSSKRQVTIPKELCDRLRVQPGDDLHILEHDGRITILKKVKGSSAGVVKHLRANARYSEAQSLEDTLEQRRRKTRRRGSS